MASTRYAGAWQRTSGARAKPGYGRTTPAPGANPNLGSGARLEHLRPVEPETGFPEPTPNLPSTPAYLYAADDFMLPLQPYGTDPMIQEPEGHEFGGVDRDVTLIQGQQLAGRAHSADYGAAATHHHDAPIMRADGDVYQTQRMSAEMEISGSRMALVRGRNAYPENNPDGPPTQGSYVMRWIDRQYKRRGIRTDVQPLRPYRAAVAADAPAPGGDTAGNAYTSPFQRLGLARRSKLTTPMLRRVPRDPGEFAETDGTDDPQYAAPVYWEM